ncbi:MAG TPA: ABC transporter permease, partial [Pyrinomonadaceae bacterium]|nr:ABC transporter permease [Pyrinomonadaceae bacterium]
MITLWQDLKYGARIFIRSPGFTIVAILALALGIGTNTSIFSVVNGVLLRPLPYPGSERLVWVGGTNAKRGISDSSLSMPDYSDWKNQADAFESMAAFIQSGVILTTDNAEPERVPRALVTTSFFPTMAVNAVVGRYFSNEDERWGSAPVAVLSHGLWQRRFGSNPGIIGSRINLGGRPTTVIGVLPAGFDYPSKAQIYTPLKMEPEERRDNRYVNVLGRLKPTATLAGAQSQIDTLNTRLQQQYPETNDGWTARLTGLQEWTTRDVRT